jgi:lysylphosphatidylglycerol synthetase-like protein (DUF2156 family)
MTTASGQRHASTRRRTATLLVGVAFAVAMLGTTLPTPLYPFRGAPLAAWLGLVPAGVVFAALVGLLAGVVLLLLRRGAAARW